MDTFFWTSAAGLIAILIIILAIFAIKKYRENPTPPDYKTLYTIGSIFFIIGIPLKNYGLSIFGATLLIIGIINKNKWQEQSKPTPKQKKFLIIALVIGLVALAAGVILYYLQTN